MDRTTQGTQLQELLGLVLPPVAIAFRAAAPAGIARIEAPAPAGGGDWRAGAGGEGFFTQGAGHHNSPGGARTHPGGLSPEVAEEAHEAAPTPSPNHEH